jgi:amidase
MFRRTAVLNPTPCAHSVAGNDITDLDALSLSEQIRTRAVSCREVMNAYLAQIERWNPIVNAIVARPDPAALLAQADQRDAELARGDYKGVLHGFPQAPKDLAATMGLPTSMGSPLFRQQMTANDAVHVGRMRAAGAIFVGRTNTPEFGLGSHSYNQLYGITRNPYAPDKCAGGSSGGAAVALATRMLPVADGSDMMGSLRNPAAYNNVFGLRPTGGTVPHGPAEDLFYQQLGVDGPMARSIPDLAMLLNVMAGPDARIPLSLNGTAGTFTQDLAHDFKGTRIGWLGDMNGYLAMEPELLSLCHSALDGFTSIGCDVVEASLNMPPEQLWQTWLTLRAFLVSGRLSGLYADPVKRAQMKPEAVWEVEQGLDLKASAVYAASVARSKWYGKLQQLFRQYDYLVLPSAQVFPFAAEQHWPAEIAGRSMDTYHRWMEVVIPASLAGVPALNVPAGFSRAGLPMGLQIIGPAQADFALLQLGHAYDQATGWNKRRPSAPDSKRPVAG